MNPFNTLATLDDNEDLEVSNMDIGYQNDRKSV